MREPNRTKAELLAEVNRLRGQVAALLAIQPPAPGQGSATKATSGAPSESDTSPGVRPLPSHGAMQLDRVGTILSANELASRLFDSPGTQLVGRSVIDLAASPAEQETLRNLFVAPAPDAFGVSRVLRWWAGDGVSKPLRLELSPLQGDGGYLAVFCHPDRSMPAAAASTAEQTLLQSVLDNSPQGIYIHDDHRFLYVNAAFARLFGYDDPGEVLALGDVMACYAKGERARLRGYYRARVSGGAPPTRYEFQGLRKDGTPFWLEKFVQRVSWHGRQAVLASVASIEKRRQAQEALRDSEAQLATILEIAVDAIICVDEEQRIVLFNQGAERTFGYGAADAIGRSLDLLLPKELRASHRRYFRKFAAGAEAARNMSQRAEVSGVRKDGTSFPAEASISKVQANGSRRFAVFLRDITERRQAERELRAGQQLLQAVFDTIPHWLAVKDLEGRYVMANRALAEETGRQPEDLVGMHTCDVEIGLPTQRRGWDMDDQAVMRSGRRSAWQEVELTRPYGETRIRRVIKLPLKDEAGAVTRLVTMSEDVTELRRAENALRKAEARFRALIENASDIITIVSPDGELRYESPSVIPLLGYRPEELVGRNAFELIHAEDRPQVAEALHWVCEEPGRIRSVEFRFRRKDGTWRHLEAIGKNLIGDRTVGGVVVNSRDITERKEAQEALRESEERLRAFMDAATDVFNLFDADLRLIHISQGTLRLWGGTIDEKLGRHITEVFPGAAEPGRLEKYQEVLRTGEPTQVDGYMETPLLGRRFVSRRVIPVGSGLGIITTDLTEMRTAEEETRKTQRLLQTVFDALPHGVFVKDGAGCILMANTAMSAQYGLSTEQFVQQGTEDLPLSDENKRNILEEDRRVMRTGARLDIKERQVVTPNGDMRYWDVTKLPLLDEKGSIVGIVGVQVDATARKRLEEQLRHSQKMEALGTLAGGIAHDFNNILAPILGFAELLLEEGPPEGLQHDALATIAGSAQRAKDLVSQILLFSRRGQSLKEVSNLAPIAEEVMQLARSTLPKTLTVKADIRCRSAFVFCDPSQIHQVFLNLCVNAGQAIPNTGSITIAVEAVELRNQECVTGRILNGPHIRIAVSDTGTGIEKENLPHIFDPFFTTKEVGRGTGLGLSTVFGIVVEHGGGITVYSRPGHGTTFEVFLPATEPQPQEPPAEPLTHGTGESILFIDDEPAIAGLGKLVLERFGYRVVEMTSSRMALEAFREEPDRFDLVVTDQSMPDMKGESLAAELRALRPDIPIVLCTGHSETMRPESSHAIGIDAFIFKPASPEELGRVVHRVLNARKQAASRPRKG